MKAPTNNIVCVHGLWMPGLEMTLLRHRLKSDHGFRVTQFSYKSVTGRLERSTDELRRFIDDKTDGRVQIVAHSLGGVMSLHMLKRYPDAPVDRVVCLGSPLVDSGPARQFLQYTFGKAIIGDTLIEGVLEKPLGEWDGEQQVGVIAGTEKFGAAMFVTDLVEPHDGVVSTVETQLPGIADYLEVPVTHAGLVLSSTVAKRSASFLRDGRF